MVGRCCVRVDPAERYALPEGGEMERMTNKGGRGYSPAFDVLVRYCFVHTHRKRRRNFISCTKKRLSFLSQCHLDKSREETI